MQFLAPELVLLRAVLGVGVGDHVPTSAAAEDHDSPHLVMRELSLVERDVHFTWFYDNVAGLAVVDSVQYRLIAFIDPLLHHTRKLRRALEIPCSKVQPNLAILISLGPESSDYFGIGT